MPTAAEFKARRYYWAVTGHAAQRHRATQVASEIRLLSPKAPRHSADATQVVDLRIRPAGRKGLAALPWSEIQNERQNERRAAMRRLIEDAKRVPCADCGGTFPPVVMDFDHRGDSQKTVKISCWPRRVGAGVAATAALKKEIAACDVVCANCHRLRHADDVPSQGRRTAKLGHLH